MKTKKEYTWEPNETWLNGKYPQGEINTGLSYISIDARYNNLENDWFIQGEQAQEEIKIIHQYWQGNDITVEQAFQWYIEAYLY